MFQFPTLNIFLKEIYTNCVFVGIGKDFTSKVDDKLMCLFHVFFNFVSNLLIFYFFEFEGTHIEKYLSIHFYL